MRQPQIPAILEAYLEDISATALEAARTKSPTVLRDCVTLLARQTATLQLLADQVNRKPNGRVVPLTPSGHAFDWA